MASRRRDGVDWTIPDNFDWRLYHELNPAEYDWPMVLGPPGECRDRVAEPHPNIRVGSSVTAIPADTDLVINAANDCQKRRDVGDREYMWFPLTDPFSQKSPKLFAKAVRAVVEGVCDSRTIFLHCLCGVNRSVSVAAAAAAIIRDEGVVDVLVEMSEQRPEVYPDEAYIVLGQWLNGELPDIGVL